MSADLEEEYEKVYRYCYMKLRHQQTAEDITQETFLKFLEDHSYQDMGKRLAYLYTIARNKCIDYYRKKEVFPLEDEITVESSENKLVVSVALQHAVSKLEKEEQELIFFRYVNEISISDISKILQMSRPTVYRKLQKCLKQLKKQLGREEWV